jgi:hypothetical protein
LLYLVTSMRRTVCVVALMPGYVLYVLTHNTSTHEIRKHNTDENGEAIAINSKSLEKKNKFKKTKFRVFWDVAACSHVEVDRRFRGAYSLQTS